MNRPRPFFSARLLRGFLHLAILTLSGSFALAVVPSDLRCAYVKDPVGIDVAVPHLSWKVSDANAVRGQKQTAREIRAASRLDLLNAGKADLWNSGVVQSSQSAHVPYGGPPLASNQTVLWQVRVHDKDGRPSPWSEPARFTMGLLQADEWKGQWIHHPDAPVEKHIWFRRNVTLDQPVKSAILHIASHGYHELFVNGKKVADHHLAPPTTRLDKRSLYVSHDIAGMLQPGANTIAIWHGPGWARYGFFRTRPSLRVQMDATLANGEALSISSDSSWRCTVSSSENIGGWQYSNMGGERIDARLHRDDWNQPGFDDSGWETPKERKVNVELSAMMMEGAGQKSLEGLPARHFFSLENVYANSHS
jgi:alpha-L-rhamnosidase